MTPLGAGGLPPALSRSDADIPRFSACFLVLGVWQAPRPSAKTCAKDAGILFQVEVLGSRPGSRHAVDSHFDSGKLLGLDTPERRAQSLVEHQRSGIRVAGISIAHKNQPYPRIVASQGLDEVTRRLAREIAIVEAIAMTGIDDYRRCRGHARLSGRRA